MKEKPNTHLTLTAAVSSLILPVLNTVILGALNTIVSSDIAYPDSLSSAISFISMLISYACIFVSSACVACEVCASKSKDRTTKKSAMARIMAFAGIPLTYIAAGAVDFGFYGSSALGAQYLLFSGVSVLYELIRTLAVLLVVLLVVRKAVKKGREETLAVFSLKGTYSRAVAASTFVVFLSFILSNVTETVSLLSEYGAPQNTSETVTLILPYPSSIIYSLLGYLLACLTAGFVMKNTIKKEGKVD